MKALILSDIHAFTTPREGGAIPSYVKVGDSDGADQQFLEYLERNSIELDLLICPGDLCDRADATSLKHAWDFLNNVKRITSCKCLMTTAGNHDMDSRDASNSFDPAGFLRSLKPTFPTQIDTDCAVIQDDFHRSLWFWARHYYIFSNDEIRCVVLNSAAYHGYHSANKSVTQPPAQRRGSSKNRQS